MEIGITMLSTSLPLFRAAMQQAPDVIVVGEMP